MSARGGAPRSPAARLIPAGLLAVGAALVVFAALSRVGVPNEARTVGIAVVGVAGIYVAWQTDLMWIVIGALALSPFAGRWPDLHIPGPLSPQRWLLVLA